MARTIRPVVAADAARLCELQTVGWLLEYPHVKNLIQRLDDDGLNLAAREATMRRLITAPETESFLAAVQDGVVVGFITVGESRDADRVGETELSWIYFDPTAHGSGFAAELVFAALGHRPAYLWMAQNNTRALAFYTKLGFAPDGNRRETGTLFNEPEMRLAR